MGKRVLLVEDESSIVAALTFLLERAGFEVAVEMNGRSALAAVLGAPPDVLVLDIMLPGLDGFEILRRMRDDPRGRPVPVLMLTAKGQRGDREAAFAAGADEFITKPFANADVVAAVRRLCGAEET
jgi:DNA-binding response OmpR family regulator